MGRPGDKRLQPVTVMYIIQNVDESKAITCVGEEDEVKSVESASWSSPPDVAKKVFYRKIVIV